MNLFNSIEIEHVFETLKHIDLPRRGLHEHRHAFAEDRDGSEDADHCENHRCYRVGYSSLREEKDYQSGYYYSDTLDYITYYMDDCRPKIHIVVIVSSMTTLSTFGTTFVIVTMIMIPFLLIVNMLMRVLMLVFKRFLLWLS